MKMGSKGLVCDGGRLVLRQGRGGVATVMFLYYTR